jgi:hypothetical protein
MNATLEELLNPQQKTASAGKHEVLKTFIALASLAVAVISAANKDIPLWGLLALGAVVAFLLGFIAWAPAVWLYSKYAAWRARNRAAQMFYADLAQMLRRLEHQVSDNYTNTLASELRSFVTMRDKNGAAVLEGLVDFGRITEWVRLFVPKVDRRERAAFADAARAMNVAVSQYWWMCYAIQNRLLGIINTKLLPDLDLDKVKQAWNNGREEANRLFRDWADLNEQINAEMPESIGVADRPSLKTL